MCCGGGMIEEHCQCGAVCALKIREAISFSEKEVHLYLTEAMEWI